MSEQLSIAQVSPRTWESADDVTAFVRELSHELARRGHRVLILTPSGSEELVRESRELIRSARAAPSLLLDGDGPRVLAVGDVLPLAQRRATTFALPIDVAHSIEQTLASTPLDLVHVHEPFPPSAASAALRHSRALNVGSFHSAVERTLSTQVARRFVETFFGRLDARTASYAAIADVMRRHFPADYRVIPPGTPGGITDTPGRNTAAPPARGPEGEHDRTADHGPSEDHAGAAAHDGPTILFIDAEERPALRLFLRSLRRLPADAPWRAIVWTPEGREEPALLREALRDRIELSGAAHESEQSALARADILVAASHGSGPAPGVLLRALAAGVVPIASGLRIYDEILHDGTLGLLFEPRDAGLLAAQLARLIADPFALGELRRRGEANRELLRWGRVADEFEEVYRQLARRRHDPRGRAAIARRLDGRPTIDVDLHMHTDHSPDCATPVEALLATARERGLGAIAVTDHNEISGALEAREKADGIKVIVAEEVKTAHQGEVIGLFIERRIPRGMSLRETIDEIHRQGGIAYVPHPFDRLHAVPDYEHLLDVIDVIDVIEVFNPRVAIPAFNEEALRFAAKYRIIAGAGSDAHVTQGLGSVRIRMRDFDGPAEFLESLRAADIVRKPTSLLYVQALKFLQTKATPAPARRAARARRLRRAVRRT